MCDDVPSYPTILSGVDAHHCPCASLVWTILFLDLNENQLTISDFRFLKHALWVKRFHDRASTLINLNLSAGTILE